MTMNYEELDEVTRGYMVTEFEAEEQSENPYRSKALSASGLEVFPGFVRQAIQTGNEQTLVQAINNPTYWKPTEEYVRAGVPRTRRRNIAQASQRLGLTEFSTWYVRGLAKRLIDEGVDKCQVYRGEEPKWEPGECAEHEGLVVSPQEVYEGHRARYWPEPGNPGTFSIPFGPGCHHVIRRVPQ